MLFLKNIYNRIITIVNKAIINIMSTTSHLDFEPQVFSNDQRSIFKNFKILQQKRKCAQCSFENKTL